MTARNDALPERDSGGGDSGTAGFLRSYEPIRGVERSGRSAGSGWRLSSTLRYSAAPGGRVAPEPSWQRRASTFRPGAHVQDPGGAGALFAVRRSDGIPDQGPPVVSALPRPRARRDRAGRDDGVAVPPCKGQAIDRLFARFGTSQRWYSDCGTACIRTHEGAVSAKIFPAKRRTDLLWVIVTVSIERVEELGGSEIRRAVCGNRKRVISKVPAALQPSCGRRWADFIRLTVQCHRALPPSTRSVAIGFGYAD